MIAVVQRVKQGKVIIDQKIYSQIDHGYVILLGVCEDDNEKDVEKLTEKISTLRIMADSAGKMNKSILETKGEILLVSQFTLCADSSQGRRPSFIKAKKPDEAEKLYEFLAKKLTEKGISTKTGNFGAKMEIQIFNDGPVTIIVDTRD